MDAPDSVFGYQPFSVARRTGLGRHTAVLCSVCLLGPIVATAAGDDRDARVWLDGAQLAEVRGFALDEGFERVPGMIFPNRYSLSGAAGVTYRGAQAPEVRIDGMPARFADGRWAGDGVDIGSLEAVQRDRGRPGRGSNAPVIDLISSRAPEQGEWLRGGVLIGGDRERAQRVAGGHAERRWRSAVQASNVEWGGHRDHQDRVDRRLSFQVDRALDTDDQQLRLAGRLLERPNAQDPGALTADEVRSDRTDAGEGADAPFDAQQDLSEQMIGLQWSAEPVASERWEATSYFRRQTDDRFLARADQGVRERRTNEVGADAGVHVQTQLLGAPARIGVGVDTAWQEEKTDEFENDGGTAGDRDGEWDSHARTGGAWVRAAWQAAPDWRVHGSARVDRTQLRVADEFLGTNAERTNYTEGSWHFGADFEVLPDRFLVTRISRGHRTPTLEEALRSAALDAERYRTVEVGVEGAFTRQVHWELTAFDTRVDDRIVPDATDALVEPPSYRNVEERRFRGVEVGLRGWLTPAVLASVSVTRLDTSLEGNDPDRGNPVPGVPSAVGHAELAWQTPSPWRLALEARGAGSTSIDDADSDRADSWTEAGFRASRRHDTDAWQGRSFIAVVNLTGESYETVGRINDDQGRAFEPAPERTIYAGITLETP